MDTALIGFFGVIIGAFVSFLATLIASRRQNEVALKNIRIEILQKKISKVETALNQISTVKMDVGIGEILPQQMIGHAMVSFTEKAGISQQCQHYLCKSIAENINNLSAKVGEIIYKGKTGEELDVEEVKKVFKEAQEAELTLRTEMQNKLKSWQLELDEIIQI
ncbi:MAG: hypothetical protein L3J88_02670 [Gammaproteobacteria bacterium]|nr:hypothetical protein [Gammaproteobacteria bacterium]MCF6362258.1 hypothetical protein [Gammaproteobacteria bacterium]